ncbi:MAG TPA: flagella basal body P-ring formation protein FlgA [Candidatus Acidoferrales bacterium]
MRLVQKLAFISALLIAASLAAQTHSRSLTRSEIAAAIQTSLAANGFSAGQPLSPDDISLDTRVTVTEFHPNLTVTRFESRQGSHATHVALWTASEPRIPPFWVTIDRQIVTTNPGETIAEPKHDAPAPSIASDPREAALHYVVRQPVRIQGTSLANAATQPPLVRVGKPIHLIVQGSGMRITAKAIALEAGREGQSIRVQCEPAGKVLVAKIVSAETAEIDY